MRYLTTLRMYVFAKSDIEASRIAQKIAKKQRKKHDNNCEVIDIQKWPVGSFESTKIEIADPVCSDCEQEECQCPDLGELADRVYESKRDNN